jgi:hypothetical protein
LNVSSNLRETGHVSLAGSGPFLFGCQAGFLSPDWRTIALARLCHYYIIYRVTQHIFSQMKIDLGELVSQQEAAEMRGVSIQAIHSLVKRGRFTIIEVGRRKFLLRKEVEAFEPLPVGRPRKDSAIDQSPQSSKTAKRGSASKTKSAKKKRSS